MKTTTTIEWLNGELLMARKNDSVFIFSEDKELAEITADEAFWFDCSVLGIGNGTYEEDKAFLESEARGFLKNSRKPTANAKAKEAVIKELKAILYILKKPSVCDEKEILAKKMIFDNCPAAQYFGAEQIKDLEAFTYYTLQFSRFNAYEKMLQLTKWAEYDCIRELVRSVIYCKYKMA